MLMLAPFIPVFCRCHICGKEKPFDDGGIPASKSHPYYMKWICDDCADKLNESEENEK